MEEKMVNRINAEIKMAVNNYNGWNHSHELRMTKIDGMIDILSIYTGKEYYITENGLEERI